MRSNVEFLFRNILMDKDNGSWKLNQNSICVTLGISHFREGCAVVDLVDPMFC